MRFTQAGDLCSYIAKAYRQIDRLQGFTSKIKGRCIFPEQPYVTYVSTNHVHITADCRANTQASGPWRTTVMLNSRLASIPTVRMAIASRENPGEHCPCRPCGVFARYSCRYFPV